jgi:hypothetical protein
MRKYLELTALALCSVAAVAATYFGEVPGMLVFGVATWTLLDAVARRRKAEQVEQP